VGRGSIWGVWILESISLIFAVLLGFRMLSKTFGKQEAFWGTIVWLSGFAVTIEGGNLVEEYALLLQFIAIYIFWLSERGSKKTWQFVVIGLTLGLSILLRPNIMGVQLTIILLLAIEGLKEKRWHCFW
jgi:hypothetical protein